MKKIKHIGMSIGVLILTLVAWRICLAQTQKLQAYEKVVEVRYPEDTLTLDQVQQMERGENESEKQLVKEAVAWKQTNDQIFKHTALKTSIKANKIEIYGQPYMLLMNHKLKGQSLYEGDLEGAIITEPVAWELWGSMDVIGKTFTYNEQIYTVRGILEDQSPIVIVQVDKRGDVTDFQALRMRLVDDENIEEQLNTLRFKYNLPEGVLNNLSLKTVFLGYLGFIPGYLLGLWGLMRLYYFILKHHKYWVSAIVLGVIAVGATLLMGKMMPLAFRLPAYVIPNQWSDFDFWTNLGTQFMSSHTALNSLPGLWTSSQYEMLQSSVVFSVGLTLIGGLIIVSKVKITTGKMLFLSSLIAIIISFISIVGLNNVGEVGRVNTAYWCILPIYFGIDYMLQKWKQLLL